MDTRSVTASVILAVGIAGGLCALGSALNISSGIESFVNRDRIVTVKGLSERQVKADRVIGPWGFVSSATTCRTFTAALKSARTRCGV